jgi:glucose/arabinose dehydrogenase
VTRRGASIWLTGLLAAALVGCSAESAPETTPSPSPTPTVTASPTAEPAPTPSVAAAGPVQPVPDGDIITGLAAPWSVAPLDDDSALVSLRNSAEVLLLTRQGSSWSTSGAGTVPGVVAQGEGGLLGLAVAPSGDAVYAMFTATGDNRVVRMPWDGARLGSPSVVLSGIPKGTIHNGGRLAFAPDGTLFVATGDAGTPGFAQEPGNLAGKILRVTADGSVPADNPFPASEVYSSGHRNVQGLAFDDEGQLWASEFGAKDVDEINLIRPGANYGWPLVEGPGGGPDLVDPAAIWSPTSVASPSGIAYADGALWVATLRGRTLYEVRIAGTRAAEPISHFAEDFGRLRDVAAASDGLWLLTNNTDGRGDPRPGDDRIIGLRLQPIS